MKKDGRKTQKGAQPWNARLLEIFSSIAQHGSMSAAAKHLNLTQPAISQAVATLEEGIGFELLDRTARPPVLTLKGQIFLNHTTEVLESISRLKAAIRPAQEGPFPLLRVGMLSSFASAVGSVVINELRELASEWSITANFDSTRFEALMDRKVDFVITSDESDPPSAIEKIAILTEPFAITVSKDYDGELPPLDEFVRNLDFIQYGRDANMRRRIDHYLESKNVIIKVRYSFDAIETAVQMIGAGRTWSVLPLLGVFHAINRGENIKAFPLPNGSVSRTVCLGIRNGESHQVARRIHQACIDSLTAEFLPGVARILPEFRRKVRLFNFPASKAASGR